MDHRSPAPRMWRMYLQTLLPDATPESGVLASPRPIRRRMRDRRLRRDRVRLAQPRRSPLSLGRH
jgi:hypothetical protein